MEGTAITRRQSGGRGALAALGLAMLLPSLATSAANVALPALAAAFAAGFPQVQWVVLAYLIAVAAAVVGAGRLGDVIGRRRLMLGGIALFTLASILGGIAPSLWPLVAARAAQGLGAAIMMALALALAGEAVPKGRIGRAMGLLGSMSAVGTALGPALGGLLIAALGWRAIFLVNVPLGLAAFLLARRCLPRDKVTLTGRQRFDTMGTLLLALALAAYAAAVTTGDGGLGPAEAALLAASAIGLALFFLHQARTPSPLIPPAMLRAPALSAGLAMSALVSTLMMTTLVVGPFYLSRVLGLGTAGVGLVLSLGPLAAALAAAPAGRLADRFGAERTVVAGLLVMAAGSVAMALMPVTIGIPGYAAPLVAITLGYAVFQTSNNGAVIAAAASEDRGLVSGMLTLSRNLGLVTGASVMGAVFAAACGSQDVAVAAPADVAGAMQITFLLGAALVLAALAIAARGPGSSPAPWAGRASSEPRLPLEDSGWRPTSPSSGASADGWKEDIGPRSLSDCAACLAGGTRGTGRPAGANE